MSIHISPKVLIKLWTPVDKMRIKIFYFVDNSAVSVHNPTFMKLAESRYATGTLSPGKLFHLCFLDIIHFRKLGFDVGD